MDFIAAATAIAGPANVLSAPDDIAPYGVDWRGSYKGTPAAVLRPNSTQQVSDLIKCCVDHRIAVVPAGGRTGLTGAAVPLANGPE